MAEIRETSKERFQLLEFSIVNMASTQIFNNKKNIYAQIAEI